MNEIKIKDTKNLIFALVGCSILPAICPKNQILAKKNPEYIKNEDIRSQRTLPKKNSIQNIFFVLTISTIIYLYFNFNKFSFRKKCIITAICLIIGSCGIFGFIPALSLLISGIINVTFWFVKAIIWPNSI